MLTTAERLLHCTSYGVGTPAFIDTFGGMVKCKVIEVHKLNSNGFSIGQNEITVEVQENKGGYAQGELVQRSAAYTPPRKQRFLEGHAYRINTAYKYA